MIPQHIILLITHAIGMLNLSRPLSKFIHDVTTSMQWAHGYGEQNVQHYSKQQIILHARNTQWVNKGLQEMELKASVIKCHLKF
jgi:hypothetical protein